MCSIGKYLGAFLNVIIWLALLVFDLVVYLCALIIYTLVSVFGIFPTSRITWGCIFHVTSLIVSILILTVFLLLGACAKNLLGWIFKCFFFGFTC